MSAHLGRGNHQPTVGRRTDKLCKLHAESAYFTLHPSRAWTVLGAARYVFGFPRFCALNRHASRYDGRCGRADREIRRPALDHQSFRASVRPAVAKSGWRRGTWYRSSQISQKSRRSGSDGGAITQASIKRKSVFLPLRTCLTHVLDPWANKERR